VSLAPIGSVSALRAVAGAPVSGRFIAGTDYLHSVTVSAHNVDSEVTDSLTLRLFDDATGQLVAAAQRPTRFVTSAAPLIFPFAPLPDSSGKAYRFAIDTDAPASRVALDADDDGVQVQAQPEYGANLARLLDPWLSQAGQTLPPVPPAFERYLDRHVAECIRLKRFFFLRLAHLADAFGRIAEPVSTMCSMGAGVAYQEAFLAGRLPALQILATDAELKYQPFPMPNLRFEQLDLLDAPGEEQFDFVLSIECLEHIKDYRRAFRNQAARVKPGKYMYISVPFATREEQRDPELQRDAWELCEHYTPGFSFEDLEELFAENGFEVLHASNMFFVDVILPVRRLMETLGPGETEVASEALAQLLLLDLRTRRANSCRQAEGVRFLGRKAG